jgi:hypothetical protein
MDSYIQTLKTNLLTSIIEKNKQDKQAAITSSTIKYENITNSEAIYWNPVYFYDYELELNEKNKNIKLLNNNYALETAEQLRKVLKS